jgi:hypothetical protein
MENNSTFVPMLKQIFALFLLLAFVAQTFSSGFIMLNYFSNTAAFAKNCVNKARPKMHCNGKCQVMKKMQEDEKKDQQMPERKFENNADLFFSKSFFYTIDPVIVGSFKAIAIDKNYPLTGFSFSFFHPPQV